MAEFNGWKNRETWNVALWISNDEGLYRCACWYVADCKKRGTKPTYRMFLTAANLHGERTPDRIKYDGKKISYNELSEMLREIE